MHSLKPHGIRPSECNCKASHPRHAKHFRLPHRNAGFPQARVTTSSSESHPVESLARAEPGAGINDAPANVEQQTEAQRRAFIMQDTYSFLAADLKLIFEKGDITESRYAADIRFEDPICKIDTREGYVIFLRLQRYFFHQTFDLHSLYVSGPDSITTTWTLAMELWVLPWKPVVTVTGHSVYKVDPLTGIILSHTDYWDNLQRNAFPSIEALLFVMSSTLQRHITPDLEGPKYVVLKSLKDYEIRRYAPYLVAEASLDPGAGPASGSGFTDLARYLFGGNQQQLSMQMTTPVITTVQPGTHETVSMQFVMENRYADVSSLPAPADPRIDRKRQEGRYVAAVTFAGWPLDWEVVQAERQLRDLLIRDGLRPAPGYQLARYNDPTTPPMLRRNEVIIELEEFDWPEKQRPQR